MPLLEGCKAVFRKRCMTTLTCLENGPDLNPIENLWKKGEKFEDKQLLSAGTLN